MVFYCVYLPSGLVGVCLLWLLRCIFDCEVGWWAVGFGGLVLKLSAWFDMGLVGFWFALYCGCWGYSDLCFGLLCCLGLLDADGVGMVLWVFWFC